MFPVSPALAADSLPSSHLGFPGGSAGKEFTWNVGDLGSIPRLGRSREEGKGYSLQYSGLENSMGYSPWGRKEMDTTKRLSRAFFGSSVPCCA